LVDRVLEVKRKCEDDYLPEGIFHTRCVLSEGAGFWVLNLIRDAIREGGGRIDDQNYVFWFQFQQTPFGTEYD
jgi:hypothetical protein